MQAADSGWATHTTPDGREYYFHKGLNKTTWDKPDELKNADEKDAPTGSASDWKEFTTDAGKKYYFNATTKVTTWTMPEELKASAAAPAPAAAARRGRGAHTARHAQFTRIRRGAPEEPTGRTCPRVGDGMAAPRSRSHSCSDRTRHCVRRCYVRYPDTCGRLAPVPGIGANPCQST